MADHLDLARGLLERAEDDVRAARALVPVGEVSDAIVGFHAQQAVEKAFKGALAIHRVEFPFTHNLAFLLQLCVDIGIEVPVELLEADRLTPYAVQMRYGTPLAGDVDRERALALAATATRWALSLYTDARR